MIDFAINTVIEWKASDEVHDSDIYRILWIDPPNNKVVLFNMKDSTSLPRTIDLDVLTTAEEEGFVKSVVFVIPKNHLQEDEVSEKARWRREWAWRVIGELVSGDSEPDIYDERRRGPMIIETMQSKEVTHRTIYKLLKQYWYGGKTSNALLPDHCGRINSGNRQWRQKNGRKSLRARINPERSGIVISEEVKTAFRNSIRLWHHTTKRMPLTKVYEKMLERFFNIGYQAINGTPVPILKPVEERPTLRQFRYWHSKERDVERELKERFGSRRYDLSYRPVLGNTQHKAAGPGQFYQIDATIADVYLVHRYNREWCIGKPILYLVVDVFSRLIAGMYIGLEGPSWLGAMMALENACSDKVEYCAQHGIHISPEQWPAHHLPEHFTADRGEMLGKKPENFIMTLWVDIENLPPYKPDWKPIVERQFKTANDDLIKWLAGAVQERNLERGKRHWSVDALYDLEEFERLMIHEVLLFNNYHAISTYQRDKNMIKDDVPPIPVHLWNWGRARGYGHLRTVERDILRLNLLPIETVTVSEKGIPFHGRHYTCQTAIRQNWFVRDGKKRKVQIHYDPRSVDKIFIRLDNGRRYEECTLTDIYSRYKELRDEESLDIVSFEAAWNREFRDEELQGKAILHAEMEKLENEAKQKRSGSDKKKVNREDMRQHRKEERMNRQREEVWDNLKGKKQASDNKVVRFPTISESPKAQADYSNLIREIVGLKEDDEE